MAEWWSFQKVRFQGRGAQSFSEGTRSFVEMNLFNGLPVLLLCDLLSFHFSLRTIPNKVRVVKIANLVQE